MSVCSHEPVFIGPCDVEDAVGQWYDVPGYCTNSREPVGTCADLGPVWGNDEIYKKQFFVDQKYGLRCQRLAFPDNNTIDCCTPDYGPVCFSDPEKKLSCRPEFRNPNGPMCREVFSDVCVRLETEEEFLNAWTTPLCNNMLRRSTYLKNGQVNFEALGWIREQMRGIFSRYFGRYGFSRFNAPGTFQYQLYQLCDAYTPACYYALYQTCNQFSRQDAYNNLGMADFCGCYMNSNVYADYASFNISQVCDPLCSRSDALPLAYANGQVATCLSSFCVIDNIAINISDSKAGNISFNQICNGCGGSTACDCRITSLDIDVSNGSSIGNINLDQQCNGSLLCSTPDPLNPNVMLSVPCTQRVDGLPTPDQIEQQRLEQEAVQKQKTISFIQLVITLLLIGMLVGLIFLVKFVRDTKDVVKTKQDIIKLRKMNSEIIGNEKTRTK